MNRVPNDAEPGTGTQYHVVASPPCGCEHYEEDCSDPNHDHPNTFQYDGTRWKVGHDYLYLGDYPDVVELTAVVRKSSWCDTGPAKIGTLIFQLSGERIGERTIKPDQQIMDEDRKDLDELLVERYTGDPPLGAPAPPW